MRNPFSVRCSLILRKSSAFGEYDVHKQSRGKRIASATSFRRFSWVWRGIAELKVWVEKVLERGWVSGPTCWALFEVFGVVGMPLV
jgi:hypothetical protein